MNTRLAEAIKAEAERIGADPQDLATVMSYETGGTFDPWKKGPTTKWGTQRGLIQMGAPQREQFNYYKGMPIEDAVRASGDYLVANGYRPGDGLLQMYSIINTGGRDHFDRSDEAAGGAPGTVRDKVETQMEEHKAKAAALLGGTYTPSYRPDYDPVEGDAEPDIVTHPDAALGTSRPIDQPTLYAREQEAPKPYDSFAEEVGQSMASTSYTAQLFRSGMEGAPDFNWTLGEARGVEIAKQYPDTYHDFLLSSTSEDTLRQRMKWASEDVIRQERLGAGGWSARGAGLVGGALDPVVSIPTLLTGGMGGAAIEGLSFGGRVAAGAVSGSVTNAAMDYAAQRFLHDPHADPLMAGAAGALFGAFGGALARSAKGTSFESALAYDSAAMARRPGPTLEAAEALRLQKEFLAKGDPSEEMRLRIWSYDPETGLPLAQVGGPTGSGGAARNPQARDGLVGAQRGYALEMRDEDVARAFGGTWLRGGDITGQMTTAKNPNTRLLGAHFFEETAGFTDHSVVPDSVNSRFTARHRKMEGNFNVSYLPAKNAYIKEGGLSRLNLTGRAEREREFQRLVTDYIWDENPSPDTNPNVVKAAGAIQKGMAEWTDQLREAGMWNGSADKHYLPLIANHERIANLDEMIHHDTMERFIKEAIRNHTSEISDELAARMARGYWANLRKAGYGIEDGMSRSLHINDKDGFREAFREALDNKNLLSDKELDEVFGLLSGMLDKAKEAEGAASKGVGYLKRRTLLDYNFKANVATRDGGQVPLRVRDLFEDDAELLYRRYTRSMSGRVEFAKTKIYNPSNGELWVDGIRSEGDLARIKSDLAESYRLMPGDKRSKDKELANALENIDFGWKRINGLPVYGSEKAYAQWARRIKAFQFIRLMSNMGLNQVQETWKLVSLTGFRAAMSQLPAIREMTRAAATGRVRKDRLLAELEDMTGIGLENLWSRHDLRLADDRLGAETGGRLTQYVDNVLDAGQRLTANVSLFRQIQDWQQRWAMKAITQQIAGMARKARTADGAFDYGKIKLRDRQRLASMGIGEDDAKLLFRNLLDNSEFEGNKITGVNTAAWDAEAVTKFRTFIGRYTDRLVQQNDFGALSKWMSNPVAQLFTQFRSFVFGAWAKSTLWSLNHGAFTDPRMMVLLLGELAAGAATFAVRQLSTATTAEGWDKYWEEQMDPVNVLKNGWARTASSSVLPMFADSLLMWTPLGPQFGSARASGSSTDAMFGSPALDFLDSVRRSTRGTTQALWQGDELTQQQIKAMARLAPLGNWIPFTAALGSLIEDRPER